VSILVYLQRNGKKIHEGSLELCAKARELSEKRNTEVYGVYVGETNKIMKSEIRKTGLSEVYTYPCAESLTLDNIALAVMNCVNLISPEILLITGTLEGRSIAPTVAAYCKTGVTADCTELDINSDGLFVQIRPAFGGNIMAEIHTPVSRPQVATVRPGVFTAGKVSSIETKITPIEMNMPISSVTMENIHIEPIQGTNDSNIIIAVGGGVQRKEDLDMLAQFCKKQGILLMCSRSLVQRGWLPQSRQIGLSGTSVSAKLLITMGISGSVQFISGIKRVKRLIAINTDEKASIMMLADLPICVNLHEVILKL